jgi:leucyl aminopeptidase
MSLKLQLLSGNPLASKSDVVVFGVFEGDPMKNNWVSTLDTEFGGGLLAHLKREDFKGKKDQSASVATLGQFDCSRVVLIGLGKQKDLTDASSRMFGVRAAKVAQNYKSESLTIAIPDELSSEHLRFVSEGLVLGAYRFTKYLTGDRIPKAQLARVSLMSASRKKQSAEDKKAVELGGSIGEAVCLTRDLQNEPPNEQTPIALADEAIAMAKAHGLKVTVLDAKGLQRAKMGLFMAVAQGSVNEPRMVHMVYSPSRKAKRKVVVVGKGLTFDSGGLCIKPAGSMLDMKSDMSGAANVVGLMAAVAQSKLNIEVHGIIGCAENMPDGNAYRPGDVFMSRDGKSVEIINTDAEGRLVLADCLSYARDLNPDWILCNATLTGACVVALGNHCSAMYSTKDELAEQFKEAAKDAGELFWQMPLLEELKDGLKSDIADLKHVGERWGGSIMAALFLKEFVGDIPFLHCDIAGPAFLSRPFGMYPKGGTGHGVLTFLRFLEKQASS